MAGLKKPLECNCGSIQLKREFKPERWVCKKCANIVVSRKNKPATGVCRVCGKSKENAPFDKHGNICKPCRAAYNKQYATDNHDKLLRQKKEYYKENKTKIRSRVNAYWQGSWKTYLSDRYNSTSKTAKKRIGSDKLRNLVFEISREELYKLAENQDYKCALTGLDMEHKWGYLRSASIDRVDSNKGYVLGNIQLVCKGINLLKGCHSNKETLEFLMKINRR